MSLFLVIKQTRWTYGRDQRPQIGLVEAESKDAAELLIDPNREEYLHVSAAGVGEFVEIPPTRKGSE